MQKKYAKANKWFLIIGTLSGWLALILQLYLTIANNAAPALESVVRYFSYFTILTNIIVVLCFTLLLFGPNRNKNSFFTNPKALAAVTVYISVVGIVYNLILRSIWKPIGLQFIVNELLHAVIPILYIIYWLIFVSKKELGWSNTFAWLIYPFVYLLFTLWRGSLSGFYPYPFIDVNKLGYDHVFLNSFYLLIVFLMLSFLLVGIGKLMTNHRKRSKY